MTAESGPQKIGGRALNPPRTGFQQLDPKDLEVVDHGDSVDEGAAKIAELVDEESLSIRSDEDQDLERPAADDISYDQGQLGDEDSIDDITEDDLIDELKKQQGDDGSKMQDEESETDEGDETDEDEGGTERTFKVKVAGEEVEVPESELIAGYSRTADYTRKTQQLAAEARTVQEKDYQLQQQLNDYAHKLQVVHGVLSQMQQRDPETLAQIEHELQSTMVAHAQRVQAEQDQYMGGLEQQLQVERDLLLETLPELKDSDARQAFKTELRSYVEDELGFPKGILDGVVDHKLIVMARKAMMYDRAQVQGREKVKRSRSSIGTLKPGKAGAAGEHRRRASQASRQKRMERLRQSGSIDDAAAAILGTLRDEDL